MQWQNVFIYTKYAAMQMVAVAIAIAHWLKQINANAYKTINA